MRMYNPNYKAEGSKLWVQAEINTEYKNEHNHKYVGQDEKGFPLPSIFQERKHDNVSLPIDPWLQIHDQAKSDSKIRSVTSVSKLRGHMSSSP